MNEKEFRQIDCKVELREGAEDKKTHICGYALKFNKESQNLGGFIETLDSHCLDECDMSNVVYTFNHNDDMPLARNSITDGVGSLKLNVDGIGLYFDAVPTDTSYGRDLIENIKAGVVTKCSFAFSLDWRDSSCEDWDFTRDIDRRTIKKIKKLYDVSSVVEPAYNDTECGCRSYMEHKKEYERQMNERNNNVDMSSVYDAELFYLKNKNL